MPTGCELSVVIVVLDGGANLLRCLEALELQDNAPTLEIIVAHDRGTAGIREARSEHPAVKFVEVDAPRNYPGLRAAGAAVACGEVVAFTEDQCIPPAAWCRNIVDEHRRMPNAAIGGPVEKLRPDNLLNWAIYLRELGEYMPPMAEGPSPRLTDCNVTYKRAALQAIADVWRASFNEPQVHGALEARGEKLWLSPALLTFQQRSFELSKAIEERLTFGRLYAYLRLPTISGAQRIIYTLLSPALPLLFLARVLLRSVRKGKYVGQTLAALPYLTLFSAGWAAGEMAGYITGRPPKDKGQPLRGPA